jgi:hypothetical protein
MSRSYREPIFTCGYGSKAKKYFKRLANRTVRKSVEIQDGNWYRKVFEPWEICDYKMRWSPWPYVYFSWRENCLKWEDPTPEWKARRK